MGIFGDVAGAVSHAARGTVRAGERAVGARDTAGEQQQAAGAQQQADMAAYYQGLTPEQMAERARLEGQAAGPTYLQKWESAMPGSYNLGGNPDQANQYAAQAQETGGAAATYLNQAAQQSQGVGYQFGQDLAATGGRAEQFGQDVGGAVMGYGQQQAQNLQSMGQGYQAQGQAAAGRDVGDPNFRAMNQNLNAADPNFARSRDALGRANQNVNALTGLEAQEGPSAAQAQLQAGLNQSQASNLAMARSGRGWGGSAAAMSQAQSQNAAAGQNAANQSAVLRAQENAAYRQRAAANLGAAAGVNLGAGEQFTNQQNLDAQAAMQRAGMNLGQQQLASSANLQQQQQNDAAAQGLYGLGLNAQQSAAQTGLAGLTGGAAIGQAGLGQNMQAQQAGGEMQLAGLGQSGQQAQAAALTGLAGQQQAMAAQQQQVANQMAYQNQMIGLHQGNQNVQMNNAQLNANASQFGQSRADSYINAGIQAVGTAAGAMSDRDMKKDIEPANQEMLLPAVDTSGNGGPGGYEFGTGISGPNQAQGVASNQAAAGASEQIAMGGGGPEATKPGAASAIGKGLGGSRVGAQPIQAQGFTPIQAQFAAVPQPLYPQLSDRNEKTGYAMSDEEAKEAIDETPGFSYRYKDPEAMGATDGLQFGIMAQDLEKTPAGRSVVKKQPDGTRMVDTSRLALLEAGAMNALSKEVAEIRKLVGRGKGKAA